MQTWVAEDGKVGVHEAQGTVHRRLGRVIAQRPLDQPHLLLHPGDELGLVAPRDGELR